MHRTSKAARTDAAEGASTAEATSARVRLTGGQAYPDGQIELWTSGTLCDATVHVGSEEFQMHRSVLAASSGYMRSLLTSKVGSLSREKNHDAAITLPTEVSAPCFSACAAFMYRGETQVDTDRLAALLETAALLIMPKLIESIVDALIKHIDVSSVPAYLQLADRFFLPPSLEAAAKAESLKHFAELARCQGFAQLKHAFLVQLVASDDLLVDSEEEVFEAIVSWRSSASLAEVAAEGASWEPLTNELLSHVRFGLLPQRYLEERVENEPIMRQQPESGWLVAKALRQTMHKVDSPLTRGRRKTIELRFEHLEVGMKVRLDDDKDRIRSLFAESRPGISNIGIGNLAEDDTLVPLLGREFVVKRLNKNNEGVAIMRDSLKGLWVFPVGAFSWP